MKYLPHISLIIAIIIVIDEVIWIGKSSLAWVIIGLGVAAGLQAIYLIGKK